MKLLLLAIAATAAAAKKGGYAASAPAGARAMLRLVDETESVEGTVRVDSAGVMHLAATKCVVKSNFCSRYARTDCAASNAAVVSEVVFTDEHRTATGRIQLHADGTLAFVAPNGGCVNPAAGGKTLPQFAASKGLVLAASDTVRASVELSSAGDQLNLHAAGGVADTEPECDCSGGTAHTAQCQAHQDEHCKQCDAGFWLNGKVCSQCPPNHYCPGDSTKKPCAAGYHSAAGASQCTAFGGACNNGVLVALQWRTQENHCGTCNVGFGLDGNAKACNRCEPGSTFSDKKDAEACQPVSTCHTDCGTDTSAHTGAQFRKGCQYETRTPNASRDRLCSSHSPCANDQWEQTPPSPYADRDCQTKHCTCSHGAGSNGASCPVHDTEHCASCNSDRLFENNLCVACPVGFTCDGSATKVAVQCSNGSVRGDKSACDCNGGYFRAGSGAWVPSTRSYPGCASHQTTSCDAGHELTTTPAAHTDGACTPCASGKFQPSNGSTNACKSHQITSCNAGHELTTTPAAHTDGACTPCASGKFQPSNGSTNACKSHQTTSCDAGYGLTTKPTASNDGVCTACAHGTFQPANGSTNECKAWAVQDCKPGYGLSTVPSPFTDGACSACKAANNQFSARSDAGPCETHHTCEAGEFEKTAPTQDASGNGLTDRECWSHDVCHSSEWESAAPSGAQDLGTKTDRICVACPRGNTCDGTSALYPVACANGAVAADKSSCTCDASKGYYGGGAWESSSRTYPACNACAAHKYVINNQCAHCPDLHSCDGVSATCDADGAVAKVNALHSKINDAERRPITLYPFYRDGSTGEYVMKAREFRKEQSLNGCSGSGDEKVCLYTNPASNVAHFEFALPAGAAYSCNLLHNEDDNIHLDSAGKSMYKYVMATDAGNGCARTGTSQPCVQIVNNGNSADFMAMWAQLTVQCVGTPINVPTLALSGSCYQKTEALGDWAKDAETKVASLSKITVYPFHRDGSGNLHITDASGATVELSNAFAQGKRCTTGANGMTVCTNSAKEAGHAQIEFSLAGDASIKCNLLHHEDDAVYEQSGQPSYQLKMVTDGGNDCINTGRDKPCIKITNHGPAADVIASWAGFAVQCIDGSALNPAKLPSTWTASRATARIDAASVALDGVRVSSTQTFYRGPDGFKVSEGGDYHTVALNSCTTMPSGKACWYGKGVAWTLSSASQGIRCQILHNEDDAVYHSGLSGGGQAKYDLQLATDGGNDCPNRLDGNANLPAGTDCVEIKNAGIAGDAMATWASYKLYCL